MSQNSFRKAIGALKDSTTVGLAKVNSGYKELDIAIVKATNHVERPAKERHVKAIFAAVSATRPRADVAYCLHALARRLLKTHNWVVALKTLIVIHRALREVDPTFHEELVRRSHILNLAHFKDDSSPYAWDYSAWVRTYALFLEERLECFRVLKCDVETDHPRTKDLDTDELLVQLPALQQLLNRVLVCQPQGAAAHNFVIRLALSMVSLESVKIYTAIRDGTINLVDKFFEMQRHDAIKALDIYRRAGIQAEKLSEFYEVCKNLGIGHGERFIKTEQPLESFIHAMEEFVREAPRSSAFRKDQVVDKSIASKPVPAIENKTNSEVVPEPVKVEAPTSKPPDLLGFDDPVPDALDLDEKNSLAFAIVPVEPEITTITPTSTQVNGGTSGWELALVTGPSSNDNAPATTKLAGGLDLLTLDSLYDDAIRRNNQKVSYNPWDQTAATISDPFFDSGAIVASPPIQMAAMASQQQALMWQQQQHQMMMMVVGPHQHRPLNPFGSQYSGGGATVHAYGSGMPVQSNNSYSAGFI